MKSNKIKLSVIMLSFNHAPYIREAVDSVLHQQTDFAFEILIGDDASTDSTDRIVRDYAEQYPDIVIPVIRENNLGATQNLYDLIERARGDYLAYLECDDCWCDETKLQQQVDFLEKNAEYIACSHKIALVDENTLPYEKEITWISKKEEYTIRDFKGIILPGHVNSLVHRNIFKESQGKYKDLITLHPMIADRSLCLLLASCGPIHQIQKVMGYYRQPTEKRKSATAELYINNPRQTLDDYLFTQKLEEYAEKKLRSDADFGPHKRKLLVDAVWDFILYRSRTTFEIAVEVLRAEHNPKAIAYLCSQLAKRIKEMLI